MSKAQYDIYRRKVFDLAKTLVIKSSASADAINKGLSELGIEVNEGDPTTWKYYLNLAGRYHANDTMMTVTSLDTLQTIEFTRENLLIHLATAREYAFGSRYYNELVGRFPNQETLILGILYPVNMAQAIAAVDGEVLRFDESLVEDNETNLIPGISTWCKNFMLRWNVGAYAEADDLYAAAQLGVLYLNLPQVILNLRLANCHTPYAHTFHIREYLASFGRLDVYVDLLTKKQMLWLYRNIQYLHRNAGKRETFELLMKNILTDRGLPLAEWNMRHNLIEMPEELYADVEFARRALNFGYPNAGVDTRDIPDMLTAEQPVARGNARVQMEAEPRIRVQMENSLNDRLGTKILESAILDLTDAAPFTLSDTLLNHWIYLSHTEQYKAVVTVDNPKTGGKLTFNVKDAFILFLYTFNKARQCTLPVVPILQAIMVRRQPVPAKAVIREFNPAGLVSEAKIDKIYENLYPLGNYISTGAFYEAGTKIFDNLMRHRFLWATSEHYVERGVLEAMASHLYCDFTCDLAGEMTYDAWLAELGLDFTDFSELEFDLLATQLLEFGTGANLRIRQSLKEMQAAMLRLMTQLSSYSIQYLQSINSQPIKVLDWPVIRLGEILTELADNIKVDMISGRVLDIHARMLTYDAIAMEDLGWQEDAKQSTSRAESWNISLDYTDKDSMSIRDRVPLANIEVLNIIQVVHAANPPLSEAFADLEVDNYVLTPAEQATMAVQWQAWLDSI